MQFKLRKMRTLGMSAIRINYFGKCKEENEDENVPSNEDREKSRSSNVLRKM